jgi:hypothetical protein
VAAQQRHSSPRQPTSAHERKAKEIHMLRFIPRALCGLFAATSLTAAQAKDDAWYATFDAGITNASDPTFSGGRLTTRQGSAYGGAIGRHLGPNWRVEAAVMYRNNPVRKVSSPGFDPQPKDADWASVFVTVNALYDFDGFRLGKANVRPYVGLGVGRAQEVDTDLSVGGSAREYSGSGSARQFMAGLRWDYGSPWVADIGITMVDAGTVRLKATGSSSSIDAKYRATTVMARLGYRF